MADPNTNTMVPQTASQALGWDDTIKPAKPAGASNLQSTFTKLSLSPENFRKRRHEDVSNSHSPHGASNSHGSHSPHGGVNKRTRLSVAPATASPHKKALPQLSIKRCLETMDKAQLVTLFEELVEQQPQLYSVVRHLAPPLTPQQALEALRSYQHKIVAHLPYKGDQKGDYAFLRVRPYWHEFFVSLAEYTVAFLSNDRTQMLKTLEFLDGATQLVHETPSWSTQSNNNLLLRAYHELSEAWKKTLDVASESLPFALMTGAAWEARFQDHCLRSNGRMVDDRVKEPEDMSMFRPHEREVRVG